MRKMAPIWIGSRIPGDWCPLMVLHVQSTVPQSVKYFFAFNDLKLISGWSVWLILKTNIHLITINNHLSGDRRSLARVWIFKSVQCAWSRWSSLWSPKKMKIWRIQKIEYQLILKMFYGLFANMISMPKTVRFRKFWAAILWVHKFLRENRHRYGWF